MRSNSFIPSRLQKSIYVNFLKGNRAIVHDNNKLILLVKSPTKSKALFLSIKNIFKS
ncbi:hypothetical protein M153_250005071 [Pseudoloma neurophilia]|uniref:Uncharacterized protein n=1 Tax=Pseudoloma neurophilia TaxID=146866 RepID=A0A0R0M6A0_9MICR|nr:hypothetical protein M153_250005071 [Pseudoloma neurophilia]